MTAILLALALAAAAAPQAGEPPSRPDPEVVFARGSQGDWSMEARTVVAEGYPGRPDFPATEPTIRDMYCFARRNGIKMSIIREGGLSIEVEGAATQNGREHRLRAFDLRAFLLDGTTWEVRALSENDFTARFIDVAYAEPELSGSGIQDRHLAVRRPPGNVWLHIGTLADDLLRGHMLRLGFREEVRDPDAERAEDPMIWINVPLEGLAGALSWCQRAMASPNSLRLHPVGVGQDSTR